LTAASLVITAVAFIGVSFGFSLHSDAQKMNQKIAQKLTPPKKTKKII
jgi:hypothetical protein